MCFPTWHLEAIRSAGPKLALADRYLDIDISLDAFEEWPHSWQTVGRRGSVAGRGATGGLGGWPGKDGW